MIMNNIIHENDPNTMKLSILRVINLEKLVVEIHLDYSEKEKPPSTYDAKNICNPSMALQP